MDSLAQKRGLVHQLLGNAAHVHAGAANAPLGAQSGRGLNVIQTGHTGSIEDCLLGAGQAS
ncbi:GM11195 [Drosophila sechellia]|uniref:GM11195 n=1 Tax=Drosophila sechellia TaxID=7238 RepID=B4IKZ5_DROSE|nr:GM11195 [Drosophila sechellia]